MPGMYNVRCVTLYVTLLNTYRMYLKVKSKLIDQNVDQLSTWFILLKSFFALSVECIKKVLCHELIN